jgi:hypothetical protein
MSTGANVDAKTKRIEELEDELFYANDRIPGTPGKALRHYIELLDDMVDAAAENDADAKGALVAEIEKLERLIEALKTYLD